MVEVLGPSTTRTLIMGVVNVTPDSFSGDGMLDRPEEIVDHAARMWRQGADILDVGGESTRPNYLPVPLQEEMRRALPVVSNVARVVEVPISIDTTKPEVARAALGCGASIVNDVSGVTNPRMLEVVADSRADLVIVHSGRVAPGHDLMRAILDDLARRVSEAVSAGLPEERIILDPGLGFGKGWRENFEIIRRLRELRALGRPILIGPSRKGMIGRVLGVDVHDRMEGTLALVTLAIAGGADIVRVHDVREMARAARVTDAIVRARDW